MNGTTHSTEISDYHRPISLTAQHVINKVNHRTKALETRSDNRLSGMKIERHFGEIIGNSPAVKQTLKRVEAVAPTPAIVLIVGESGVGKELIARAIHRQSARSERPLIKVNCASIPEELFESEFFGHVKGSFTGAHRDREGRFELADGGTLFLDEVAEIPLSLQAKLLRVLQEGQFERVGDEKTRTVNVRVIAATNRDLHHAIGAGKFREDLYYRLSVFPLDIPPLRQRRDDIIMLAAHFLDQICKEYQREPLILTQRHVEQLRAYPWPGNIRELRNVIERAVILSLSGQLQLELGTAQDLALKPACISFEQTQTGAYVTEAEWQRRYRANLSAALQAAGWRVSGAGGAAELLGLKPTTLRDRMKVLDIQMPGKTVSAT